MANQIYTPSPVQHFRCSVSLSGFIKSSAPKDVLDKITTSAIYSIRKFSHKQAEGGEFYTNFILQEDAAAFASQYLKSALEIGGQHISVFYDVDATISISKELHDDIHWGKDRRTLAMWDVVENFPEGERCGRGEVCERGGMQCSILEVTSKITTGALYAVEMSNAQLGQIIVVFSQPLGLQKFIDQCASNGSKAGGVKLDVKVHPGATEVSIPKKAFVAIMSHGATRVILSKGDIDNLEDMIYASRLASNHIISKTRELITVEFKKDDFCLAAVDMVPTNPMFMGWIATFGKDPCGTIEVEDANKIQEAGQSMAKLETSEQVDTPKSSSISLEIPKLKTMPKGKGQDGLMASMGSLGVE
ncbi:hypothetical protein K505DRAFT_367064 [Melanomma pulvis-pyrius CBS 109.77]|uniref:Uncharacterized protein n=1 Tax=Melanomma pulvis-pyrius CBS 109.77 TaxID=1314802 RepID=A0A6A6WV56_9PLEO|nr:hypothetical protein K505DRAFT_367064 [Melanomma pulvis-pyrius CBS 109.77]